MPTKMRDCCMYARTPCVKSEFDKFPHSNTPTNPRFTYRVTNNTDGVASRQPSQSNTEAASQVHEAVEQTVLHIRWRLHVPGDKDCNHQGIHSNDTRHDDWDEGLLLLALVPCTSFCSPHTFMMRSDLKVPTPAIPMPDLAVPYAAPMPVPLLSNHIVGS